MKGGYRVPRKMEFQLPPVGCVRALTTSTAKPASSMRLANSGSFPADQTASLPRGLRAAPRPVCSRLSRARRMSAEDFSHPRLPPRSRLDSQVAQIAARCVTSPVPHRGASLAIGWWRTARAASAFTCARPAHRLGRDRASPRRPGIFPSFARRTARDRHPQALSGVGRDPRMSGNCELGRGLLRREKNATEAGAGRFEKPAPDARAAPR